MTERLLLIKRSYWLHQTAPAQSRCAVQAPASNTAAMSAKWAALQAEPREKTPPSFDTNSVNPSAQTTVASTGSAYSP